MSHDVHRIVRDPLWDTIRVHPTAVRIVDTAEFQRLRYIRQLGFAHLVYPGRHAHALRPRAGRLPPGHDGAQASTRAGGVPPEVWEGEELIPYAALLHDIGHYAYSHALEELETDRVPADHEAVSRRSSRRPAAGRARAAGPGRPPTGSTPSFSGESPIPLQGLVSGSLDLDKMEYLRRDARFCGVPYGEVDVDRLLQGLTLLPTRRPGTTRSESTRRRSRRSSRSSSPSTRCSATCTGITRSAPPPRSTSASSRRR
jgi:uncharacterized protein